ncbi:DUF5133 domain-containing protein [Streptomyces sp. NPDC050504]|uniref:DUF5133 domain-containing protein n=1 Tax=Streptomyces sp. NPDC050504 TaxID=3365618 RepID=UPI0037A20F30
MLMAHPAVLADLVERYETLSVLYAKSGTEKTRRRMEDVAYTLCVTTGTRHVEAALAAARDRLPGALAQGDPLLTVPPRHDVIG